MPSVLARFVVALVLVLLVASGSPASAAAKLTVRVVATASDGQVTVKVRASKRPGSRVRAVLQRRARARWGEAASATLRARSATLRLRADAGSAVRLRVVLRRGTRVLATSASTVVRLPARTPTPKPTTPAPRPTATPVPTASPNSPARRRSLAASQGHGCELRSGTVRCWGQNDEGQVGDGSTHDQRLARPVLGLTDGVSLAAGAQHTCALRADGTVWCWGLASASGRQLAPTAVPGLSGVTDLLAGGSQTCARSDDRPWQCWGGASDRLSATPTPLAASVELLSLDGGVRCWKDTAAPAIRCDGLRDAFAPGATAVSASRWMGCAIVRAGVVECILRPSAAGETAHQTFEAPGASDVGVSGTTVCIARSEAPVECSNLSALLTGDAVAPPQPVAHSAGIAELVGDGPLCGYREGTARCLGSPARGALGDGRDDRIGLPAPSDIAGPITRVAMDQQQACGIGPSGATCWGMTTRGNVESDFAAGAFIAGTVGATDVAVTGHGACVVSVSASARCWGTIPADTLAPSTSALFVSTTATNAADLSGLSGIDGGILSSSTCALRAGDVVCWGGGEPAPGPWVAGTQRGAVAGFTGVSKIATGAGLCAVITAGVRCQAPDRYGLSGDAPTSLISSTRPPATLSGSTGAVDVDLSTSHACLVNQQGEVRCWGRNESGQLGRTLAADATATNLLAPVPGISGARAVAVGSAHSCVIRGSGSVSCWGANDDAQLGDPALSSGTTVRDIAGIADALTVSAGGNATCVTRSSHPLTCWGAGDQMPYPRRASELVAVRVLDAP